MKTITHFPVFIYSVLFYSVCSKFEAISILFYLWEVLEWDKTAFQFFQLLLCTECANEWIFDGELSFRLTGVLNVNGPAHCVVSSESYVSIVMGISNNNSSFIFEEACTNLFNFKYCIQCFYISLHLVSWWKVLLTRLSLDFSGNFVGDKFVFVAVHS